MKNYLADFGVPTVTHGFVKAKKIIKLKLYVLGPLSSFVLCKTPKFSTLI